MSQVVRKVTASVLPAGFLILFLWLLASIRHDGDLAPTLRGMLVLLAAILEVAGIAYVWRRHEEFRRRWLAGEQDHLDGLTAGFILVLMLTGALLLMTVGDMLGIDQMQERPTLKRTP